MDITPAHTIPDFEIVLTFADDDGDRQPTYDRIDRTFARLAAELWSEEGVLMTAVDRDADLDVAGVLA